MEAQLDAVVDINPAIGPLDEPETPKNQAIDQTIDQTEVKPEPKDEPIPKGVQKRIDRAVRQKYEAEARAKILEERVAAMEARQTQQPQQRKSDNSEPTIEDFDSFQEFVDARAEWKYNQKEKQRRENEMAEREATERKKTVDSWSKRLAQATADDTMPDFEDTIGSSDAPITSAMQRAIMESDVGPRVAYYLAKNPDEAERIAGMPEDAVMRAIGRIEERLETQKKQVTPTNTPEPIKPVSTRTTVSKDPGKMSDAEYAKWRAQGRQRR